MLAIRCQFLQGTYQAAEPGAPTEREWPPHPGRLHAALVAAGWTLSGEEFHTAAQRVLAWLERIGPPALTLPEEASARTAPTVYVPRNLSRAESASIRSHLRADPPRMTAASRESGRVGRRFPTTVVGDAPIWFIWGDVDVPAGLRKTLALLVESVQYLGSSRSPVCCAVVDEAPPPNLSPSAAGRGAGLRVASPGLTRALIASREEPTIDWLLPTATYSPPASSSQPPATAGPFLSPLILRRSSGFGLTVAHTGLLASAFRRAVLSRAGDRAPSVLHGHGRNPHAAYAPLPNVGHPNSSGEILGLALILPADAEAADRDASIAAAIEVEELRFDPKAAPWSLTIDTAPKLRTLNPATWTGPARVWRSATPVVLDQHPKQSRNETFVDMLHLSFMNAGLPTPTDLRVAREPFLPGAIAGIAQANGQIKRPGIAVHCEARFEEPLRGPVLVGRGRYFGVGLLKPVASSA